MQDPALGSAQLPAFVVLARWLATASKEVKAPSKVRRHSHAAGRTSVTPSIPAGAYPARQRHDRLLEIVAR
ncbi:hypothetical protein N658DRAFT_348018 [Parathielavia hyrcaniae]|uniref:Uncharacterized protein n=1 Tax=Parathielavia hyrcaniae TaxID=113614 RepID=A0AAN6PT44_9PEZI|nr:hypothetical protein N658DRAFT_348018 [Parathielavia hyrcaniae]